MYFTNKHKISILDNKNTQQTIIINDLFCHIRKQASVTDYLVNND